MSASKDLYLRDKQESQAGMSLVTSPTFERLLVFAIAEFASLNPSKEQIEGANRFISLLKSFPDDPGKNPEFPGSGLKHEESASNTFAVSLKPTV